MPALNMHRFQRVATILNRVVPNVLPLRQRQMETWRSNTARGPTGRLRTVDAGAIKLNAARFASNIMTPSCESISKVGISLWSIRNVCILGQILNGDLAVKVLARSHGEYSQMRRKQSHCQACVLHLQPPISHHLSAITYQLPPINYFHGKIQSASGMPA